MSDANTQIRARIDSFVVDLTALVRQAALEAVQGVLGGTAARRSAPPSSGGASGASRRKGEKRDPASLARTVTDLAAYIAAHPGQRLEEIAKGLPARSVDLKLPIIKLLTDKTITKKGVKRGTQYFAAANKSAAKETLEAPAAKPGKGRKSGS